MGSSRQKLSPEDKEMMREFEITDDESSASDLARMRRDQRGRVPDALGQDEADDADTSEQEDAAVAESQKWVDSVDTATKGSLDLDRPQQGV